MPSRVRSIDLGALTAPQFSDGVDLELVAAGRNIEQIGIVTLPASAIRLIGLRIGVGGDAVRLNAQGQVLNITGDDKLGGVWLVWMAAGSTPTGIIEFALGLG